MNSGIVVSTGFVLPQMRDLPGGTFLMGDVKGRADEQPVHRVTVSAFAIGIHPVTNAEYARFLIATKHAEPAGWMQPRFDHPRAPVCGVSWEDAVAYAAWISGETGQSYHLPTEAQREYACRGGREQQAYPWGDEPLPLEGVYERGLSGPITGGPMVIGDERAAGANDFGLYHMADNVHEWCADYYDATFYVQSSEQNPRGPSNNTRRAARGGSWRHDIKYCRCAARSSLAPNKRFEDFGFRLARSDAFEYIY